MNHTTLYESFTYMHNKAQVVKSNIQT